MKFEMGEIYMTAGIMGKAKIDSEFFSFLNNSIGKYKEGDWGETCKEDKSINEEAIRNGERIFAVYKKADITIWIITEWDRSYTTVLFPSEY